MRLRDRAERQLYNIQQAKDRSDRSGCVPVGMQIKVKPGNEDVNFQLQWAKAISTAEEALSATTEKQLTNLINQVDGSIHEKLSNVLDRFRKWSYIFHF